MATARTPQAPAALKPERQRLEDARSGGAPWYRWGPYLSEHQGGHRA